MVDRELSECTDFNYCSEFKLQCHMLPAVIPQLSLPVTSKASLLTPTVRLPSEGPLVFPEKSSHLVQEPLLASPEVREKVQEFHSDRRLCPSPLGLFSPVPRHM